MLSRTLLRFLSQRALSRTDGTVLVTTIKILPTRHAFLRHSAYVLQPRVDGRPLSTLPPQINHSDLSPDRYHALADATMLSLLERLEDLLDEIANESFEVDYHSGVLTLNLDSHGTYVINKQPPNKQIWLSSPISGPKRYDYVPSTDDWRYSRDGEEMGGLLERELSGKLGRKVNVGLGRISEAVE